MKNTLFLVFGVGVGVAFLGTQRRMAHHHVMNFRCGAFLLGADAALAVPAYVLAFTQLGLFRLHRRHQHLAAQCLRH